MYFGWKHAAEASALTLLSVAACTGSYGPVGVQGWTRQEQLDWHHGNQGSRLIPLSWAKALETATGNDLFFTTKRLTELGYLASEADDSSVLPIGFSTDESDDRAFERSRLRWFKGQSSTEPWLGMTCSACHTGEVRQSGQRVALIDGAPGNGDFQTFIEQLDAAAAATLADDAKFDLFAQKVFKIEAEGGKGPAPRPQDLAENNILLRQSLKRFVDWQTNVSKLNNPHGDIIRYGMGRLDAFGHIFNKVALVVEAEDQFAAPSDAPVSYPFLWNIHQHDRVQWNGIAPNKGLTLPGGTFDIGAIGRNTGEVIGVFADVKIPKTHPGELAGYVSSVHVRNLDAIEARIGRLYPPAYPTAFAPRESDPAKQALLVRRGGDLFAKHCVSCHARLEPKDLKSPIKAVMTPIWGTKKVRPVGTDPWMACNAFTYRMLTGRLQGSTPVGYYGNGPKMDFIGDTREVLATVVAGTLVKEKGEIIGAAANAFFGLPRPITGRPAGLAGPGQASKAVRLEQCKANAGNVLLAYKGRPLNGIWATGPYLHNGSVRTLYQLLLKPADRETEFAIGSREFDVTEVGFIGGTAMFRTQDAANRPILGNSNDGHDYGTGITDDERWALVEYLKTL